MLEVTFYRDSRDRLSRLVADGHADWAEAEDYVCAAGSAVLQAAWLGLLEHAHIAVDSNMDPEAGHLDLRWSDVDRLREDVQAIVDTARLAMETLARQYPENVRSTVVTEPA